jgi:hypothetical protein
MRKIRAAGLSCGWWSDAIEAPIAAHDSASGYARGLSHCQRHSVGDPPAEPGADRSALVARGSSQTPVGMGPQTVQTVPGGTLLRKSAGVDAGTNAACTSAAEEGAAFHVDKSGERGRVQLG